MLPPLPLFRTPEEHLKCGERIWWYFSKDQTCRTGLVCDEKDPVPYEMFVHGWQLVSRPGEHQTRYKPSTNSGNFNFDGRINRAAQRGYYVFLSNRPINDMYAIIFVKNFSETKI